MCFLEERYHDLSLRPSFVDAWFAATRSWSLFAHFGDSDALPPTLKTLQLHAKRQAAWGCNRFRLPGQALGQTEPHGFGSCARNVRGCSRLWYAPHFQNGKPRIWKLPWIAPDFVLFLVNVSWK